MAVFGLSGTRQKAYRKLPKLGKMLHELGIQEIWDIGPEIETPCDVSGIPVKRMGVLAVREVASRFSQSRFGFLAYPLDYLTKSGVFAGYCAHGTIPVLPYHLPQETDGLKDGVHVISPQTVKAAMTLGLEECSNAAWRWYQGHQLHDHAAIYARWLDQLDRNASTGMQMTTATKEA